MRDTLPDNAIPPEWVRLTAVPGWIARIYGVTEEAVWRDLVLAVRRGTELRHRIPGIKPRFDGRGIKVLPAGLDHKRNAWSDRIIRDDWIIATDWEAAEAYWNDSTAGTVGGWPKTDGTRERLPIEVAWEAVEAFAELRLRRWKRQEATRVEALAAADAAPASSAPKRSWAAQVRQCGSDRRKALEAWAIGKVSDGQLPGHEKLLAAHVAEFGHVAGISDTTMREVRPWLQAAGHITEQSGKGGAMMHKKRPLT